MQMRGKKGLFFMLDVVVGMSILLIGIIFLLNYFYTNPISNQPQDLSNQILDYLLTTKIGEVSNYELLNLTLSGNLSSYNYISEEFALLCKENNNSFFKYLSNLTIGNIVPNQFNFSVGVINSSNGEKIIYCLNQTNNPLEQPEIISVSKAPIITLKKDELIGPYYVEVKVW